MSNMTLGSLFDGSGGFPLGGMLAGITPVWASEIEPFPIRVTTKRLPFMKHYGDVSKLDGAKLPPVDIITFGSPCQDMSVAGKRAGLDGSRSNLFYEAIRIVKEMRCATNGKYPRYIVWENVPGAFSSNKGQDFRSVLEAVCSVKDTDPVIPEPPKGRWDYAGSIVGDGYSVAWRTLDAQFWGVPQRRRRIYLVADFAGGSAGKVLFESESLSGYSPQGFRSWQTAPGDSANCSGTAGIGFDGYNAKLTGDKSATLGVNCGMSTGRNGVMLNDQGGNRMDVTEDVTCTLRAEAHHPPCVLEEAVAVENHPMDGRVKLEENGKVQTLSERMGTGGNNVPLVLIIRSGCEGNGSRPSHHGDGFKEGDTMYTLNAVEQHAIAYSMPQAASFPNVAKDKVPPLLARDFKDATVVTEPSFGIGRDAFNQGANAQYRPAIERELQPTIVAKGPDAVAQDEAGYIVRRLTPTECARVQGFPDWWCSALGTEEPSEEDIAFWRDVFETHRAVTGSASKPKTDAQLVKRRNCRKVRLRRLLRRSKQNHRWRLS